MQKPKFHVEFLQEAADFLDGLEEKVRNKIIYNTTKARYSNDKELFKKLKGEIWEFRTLYGSMHYRLFAFWDKSDKAETVVISTHGLVKKSAKTPKADIDRAEGMRRKYFEQKNKQK